MERGKLKALVVILNSFKYYWLGVFIKTGFLFKMCSCIISVKPYITLQRHKYLFNQEWHLTDMPRLVQNLQTFNKNKNKEKKQTAVNRSVHSDIFIHPCMNITRNMMKHVCTGAGFSHPLWPCGPACKPFNALWWGLNLPLKNTALRWWLPGMPVHKEPSAPFVKYQMLTCWLQIYFIIIYAWENSNLAWVYPHPNSIVAERQHGVHGLSDGEPITEGGVSKTMTTSMRHTETCSSFISVDNAIIMLTCWIFIKKNMSIECP